MRRYLLAAIWPAGLAAIASATLVAAQRASSSPGQAAVAPLDPGPYVAYLKRKFGEIYAL